MNFTSSLPTEPGFYACKKNLSQEAFHLIRIFDDNGCLVTQTNSDGMWVYGNHLDKLNPYFWCRFVPADELSSIKVELNNFQKGYAELSDLVQALKKEKEESFKAGMTRAAEIVKDYHSCNKDCSGNLLQDIEQEIQKL